jgi:uncharacterized iron-regulated membrane protein
MSELIATTISTVGSTPGQKAGIVIISAAGSGALRWQRRAPGWPTCPPAACGPGPTSTTQEMMQKSG